MLRSSRPEPHGEQGVTLVELLIAMSLVVVFMGTFATGVTKLFDTAGAQQARSDNMDVSRTVVQVLDRQVRYARAVNAPFTATNGSQWIEWQVRTTGSTTGAVHTCYQWHLRNSGALRWRSWVPAASGPTTPTAWTTVGNGVRTKVNQLFTLSGGASSGAPRQQLTLDMLVGHGSPLQVTRTTTTFTALNSRTAAGPSPEVCQEVPRS